MKNPPKSTTIQMGSVSCVSHSSRALTHYLFVDYLSSKNSVFFKNRICTVKFRPSSSSSMATSLQVNASSTVGYFTRFVFVFVTCSIVCLIEKILGAASDEVQGASSDLAGEKDLMIVGPGVLGRLVADQWRQEHPGCQIYGQTVTTDHHEELIEMAINPCVKGSEVTQRFPYVIFCAPPSRSSDYPGDVRLAAMSWNGEGSFLFTSSSAPFDCNDNGPCDEDSPIVPIGRNPKTDILLKAEKVVLEFGGCVVRLAGLYKADRGAHTYWLGKGTVEVRPDHILNLIHYEDAASLSVAILKKKLCGRILLGCDNHPVSRQEVMDLVSKSGKFSKQFEGFTGTTDPLGKRLNNSKTRQELEWEPKYPSFAHFLGVSE